jgi:hypothetical protein
MNLSVSWGVLPACVRRTKIPLVSRFSGGQNLLQKCLELGVWEMFIIRQEYLNSCKKRLYNPQCLGSSSHCTLRQSNMTVNNPPFSSIFTIARPPFIRDFPLPAMFETTPKGVFEPTVDKSITIPWIVNKLSIIPNYPIRMVTVWFRKHRFVWKNRLSPLPKSDSNIMFPNVRPS